MTAIAKKASCRKRIRLVSRNTLTLVFALIYRKSWMLTAMRMGDERAKVLGIDVDLICKNNPYQEETTEVLPEMLPNYLGVTDKLNRKTYIENRLGKVLMLVDYEDMPKVDELVADFIQMDDEGRKLLFGMLESLKATHTDKKRKKSLTGVLEKVKPLHLNLKD